jgi:hypothetical protein
MPCEKNTQVAGTLLPQDKEGFGSFISHEENVKFIFEESRTTPINLSMRKKMTQKQQPYREEPNKKN